MAFKCSWINRRGFHPRDLLRIADWLGNLFTWRIMVEKFTLALVEKWSISRRLVWPREGFSRPQKWSLCLKEWPIFDRQQGRQMSSFSTGCECLISHPDRVLISHYSTRRKETFSTPSRPANIKHSSPLFDGRLVYLSAGRLMFALSR